MKKRTASLQFSEKSRKEIIKRDQGCIFCKKMYFAPRDNQVYDLAHVVNKSQGGLGIPENGVLACRYHHYAMDNGPMPELRTVAEKYLKSIYPGWSKSMVTYSKWRGNT